MNFEIGRVLSTSWEMFKQRFWLLVGMVAIYFAIQAVSGTVFMMIMGGSMLAMGAAAGSMEPSGGMLGGIGVGMFLLLIVFYVGYIVIALMQQGSMTALATPIRRVSFGDALNVGFKTILTWLGLIGLFILAYVAFVAVTAGVAFVAADLGEILSLVLLIVIVPLAIWVGLRLSVIVPVVAVDGVTNPIAVVKRTWGMTSGNALRILVVYIVLTLVALAIFAVPFFLMFGAIAGAAMGGDPSGAAAAGAIGGVLIGLLLFIPAFLVYTVAATAVVASLHAEMSDTGAVEAEQTFS